MFRNDGFRTIDEQNNLELSRAGANGMIRSSIIHRIGDPTKVVIGPFNWISRAHDIASDEAMQVAAGHSKILVITIFGPCKKWSDLEVQKLTHAEVITIISEALLVWPQTRGSEYASSHAIEIKLDPAVKNWIGQ